MLLFKHKNVCASDFLRKKEKKMQKNQMSFLKNFTTVSDARTARVSSWDQSGRNKDYWLVEAGKTVTITDIDGPGCINHIWVTSFCREILGPSIQHPVLGSSVAPVTEMENAEGVNWEINDPDYYRKVLIKMTWDDFDGPSVLTPLGDFFCIGHSMPASFSSLPFNVSSRPCEERTFGGTAAMNCYFPMPFNKRAKIEIINENERPLGLFFHVDYELYHEETKNIAYFQAAWRRDMPCAGWGNDLCVNSPEVNSVPNLDGKDNFQMLDVKGRGHYVGCNLSVLHFQGSWWGEGDDMICIDDEEVPSINGTGAEDYFNHAWGMQRNQSPYNGTIIHDADTNGYQVSYRFHLTDPIHFKKHIQISMEHGHANHLSDDWACTAYWYQMAPVTEVTIQPVEERLVLKRTFNTPKPKKEAEMTLEMNEAYRARNERMKVFEQNKREQIRLNGSRTAPSEEGNRKLARKVKNQFDQERR